MIDEPGPREDFRLGLFQSTPEGRFLWVNQAFARMFGYDSPDELLANIQDIRTQVYLDRDLRPEILSAMSREGAMGWFESDFRRRDGSVFTAHMGMRALRDEAGRLRRLDGFVEDVTVFLLQERTVQELLERLTRENQRLRSTLKDQWRLGELVGKSPIMQEAYQEILRAAATSLSVVITGESGTGKELAARAIHALSDRAKGEFVAVNCGAIPPELMEREFFGHRKGAFTSAHADLEGYLDLADGGTLFLDEVGELGLEMQVKLLRALERGYSPVGDSRTRTSDFRLIAATNRDLRSLVKTGQMREDFFYRIQVLPIRMPSLRERLEDIPLLVENFLTGPSAKARPPILPYRVMEALYRYDWPGNVRELTNVLQRYLAMGKLDLPEAPGAAGPAFPPADPGQSLAQRLAACEKAIIEETLGSKRWRRGEAAKALDVDRKTLYNKMRALGIS